MSDRELKRIRYATEHFKTFGGLLWIPVFCLLSVVEWTDLIIYRVFDAACLSIFLLPAALAGLAWGWWLLHGHQLRRFGRVEPSDRFRRRFRGQNLVVALVLLTVWAAAFWLHEPGARYEFYWIWFGLFLVGNWWMAGLRPDRSYFLFAGLALVGLAFVLPRWLATAADDLGGLQTEVTVYLVVRSVVEIAIGLVVGLLDYRALARATRPIGSGVPGEPLRDEVTT